jgi:rhodanese-related sulfurtransferase
VKKVLGETALVAIVGIALAFAANAISSRGLKLGNDYFHGATRPPKPGSAMTQGGTNATKITQHMLSPAEAAIARLREKGLQVADDEKILTLFHDPRYEQGLVIFIDARKDEEYSQGHIPGAYQLDPMYKEKYLGSALPACTLAQQIVIYCHGGDCELSEFAAEFLRGSAGIPNEKLFIYANGIPAWQAHGLPIEKGDRKSGQISSASK